MPIAESEVQAALQQLERVLASPGFSRNERLGRFLQFVVEQHLEGRDSEIKESVIAFEVFGRGPDHDPKQDSIVRTEASRLRARLSEYYTSEGKNEALVIELPKGGYVPVFRQIPVEPALTTLTSGNISPRPGTHIRFLVALAGMAAAVGAVGLWWSQYQNAPIAIAVLPLVNMSQGSDNDYFADGLTGEMIRDLSIIEGLAVRSQTSTFALKGKPRNVREAGKQLGADYILEGSVLRAGLQLRINVQLVRVRDDFPLWSGTYNRMLTDVFTIQDEISRGIVNSLRLKLGGRRRYETSVEAYDLYLRARSLAIQRGLPGLTESVVPFEKVIEEDPSFAPAYAGLAAAHAVRSGQFTYDLADEMAKMRAAAVKAIQLDPLLAEAHDALGRVYARDGQWELSERSFRRAIQLDPNRSTTYDYFVIEVLLPLGRIEEALKQLRVAEKADPLSPDVHYFLYYVLNSAGRYDEASGHCSQLPTDFWARAGCRSEAQIRQGRIAAAIQSLETEFHSGGWRRSAVRGFLGCAYVRAGRREEAEKIAAASSDEPFAEAKIFACLGDKDRAFQALDRAAAAGPTRIGRALTFPEFALLRGDPRVKDLRRKVGLPE